MDTILSGNAVAIAVDASSPLLGVLLRGASGSGKSDLSLRLIEGCPFQRSALIADDRVEVIKEDASLWMRAPPIISGQLEIRGIGICAVRKVAKLPLFAIIDLVDQRPARLPERADATLAGLQLPYATLLPFEASAPAKLRVFLRGISQKNEKSSEI